MYLFLNDKNLFFLKVVKTGFIQELLLCRNRDLNVELAALWAPWSSGELESRGGVCGRKVTKRKQGVGDSGQTDLI